MPIHTEKNYKLYYSIAEVAEMFDVNQSLLRFWEKEFPQIAPKTNGRGVRQYRKEDVDTIALSFGKRKRDDPSRCPSEVER